MADLTQVRSKTDPPAPEHNQRTDRPIIPKRLHAASFRSKGQYNPDKHGHHSHRERAKETVQSAIELKPPITFDHILRRDKKYSPDSSRTGSVTAAQAQADSPRNAQQPDQRQKVNRPEDVDKARKENEKREEQLRESLKSVEEVGMSSTRQLDDTYYAILEKASILRSTVASIQQLADESHKMHSSFKEDTAKIERDTKQNLSSYGNFDQQEKRVNQLVSQLGDSRGRTDKLNDRLESARLRVEAVEQQENARQAQRRTRWHILWGSVVGFLLLVVAILLARNRRAVGQKVGTATEQLLKLGDIAEDVVAPLSLRLRAKPSEDPYLSKLFDEL